jgi:hypothetical protein
LLFKVARIKDSFTTESLILCFWNFNKYIKLVVEYTMLCKNDGVVWRFHISYVNMFRYIGNNKVKDVVISRWDAVDLG